MKLVCRSCSVSKDCAIGLHEQTYVAHAHLVITFVAANIMYQSSAWMVCASGSESGHAVLQVRILTKLGLYIAE